METKDGVRGDKGYRGVCGMKNGGVALMLYICAVSDGKVGFTKFIAIDKRGLQ